MSLTKQIVIIALGNTFRGDDGVGTVVNEALKKQRKDCAFIEGQDDSLAIINAWENADLCIIVDAAAPAGTPGKITRLELEDQPLPRDMASCSSHGLGLAEAIELGLTLGKLPGQLIVYAVEAESFEHGERLSPAVAKSADDIVNNINNDVSRFIKQRENEHA